MFGDMYNNLTTGLSAVDDTEDQQYKPIGSLTSQFAQPSVQQSVQTQFANKSVDPYHSTAAMYGHPVDPNLQPRDANGIRRFSDDHVAALNNQIKDNTGLIASLRGASPSQAQDMSGGQSPAPAPLDPKKAYTAYQDASAATTAAQASGDDGILSMIGDLL